MREMLEISGPQPDCWRLTGRHVLIILFAFFGVVFGVNSYFLFSALSTHTGVVSAEPYRKGLAYNTRIAADEQQTALGWSEVSSIAPDGTVTIAISDRNGAPVGGLSIDGVLSRPSTANADLVLQLKESAGGNYLATTSAPAPGAWIITFEARRQNDSIEPVYRARRRLWLKP